MSFISNADHFTLGEGVYNNVHGNIVNNNFYGRKRHRDEINDGLDLFSSTHPIGKRRRREEEDGITVIRREHLELIREIRNGPGYLFHVGQYKGRAVIVKVFNAGPTVREQLESTVALSKGLLHPNVLRIQGISLPVSLAHFIVYENMNWKNPEGSLAAALKDDLTRSITLGFKMIAGLSSGMNHLSVQGISLASLGVENFDIFLDIDDRFLIGINPRMSAETDVADYQEPENNNHRSWDVFNALCQKVLRSANRVLHNEPIDRNPVTLDSLGRPSIPQNPLASLQSFESTSSQNHPAEEPPVPPRREYVWRTIDRGQQSLATVSARIALDLDMKLSSLNRLAWTDGKSPHRCAGYVREEITLATTTVDSAVVSHDSPSPLEICSICHEVVGLHEEFQCICGDPNPGSRHTVKCMACKLWSHSDCVGNPKEFTCQLCIVSRLVPSTPSVTQHWPTAAQRERTPKSKKNDSTSPQSAHRARSPAAEWSSVPFQAGQGGSRPHHLPGCMCSSCHLSSKLFPRGPNDRVILPAIIPYKIPFGGDPRRFAPPRPQSTAPQEYRPRR